MIPVVVRIAAGAEGLAQRLADAFERAAVTLDAESGEVSLSVRREAGRTVPEILRTIDDWLEETGVDSAALWLDGNPYALERWPVTSASALPGARRRAGE